MDADRTEIPFVSNLGLMLTYKCTVACPHCVVEAGPHRKEEMPLEHCLRWMEQARAYREGHVKGLALTGGEPFYDLARLARISAHGSALGFIVSVVTNAFWAPSKAAAVRALSQVPAIQMVSISTDVYHQKAIPFGHVRNAVLAARELGRLYNVAICTENEEDPEYLRIIEDLRELGEADRLRVAITFPVGRARVHARRFRYRTASEPVVSACTMASSPVVFPNGDVIACIGPLLTLPPGHPMYLGSLQRETLAEILDRAEANPVLHTIRVWGPHKLVSLLRQNGRGDLLPKQYIDNCPCDVCYKLLSDALIVEALQNVFQDDQLRQFVAYGRAYYLQETTMAERLGLSQADRPSGP